MEIFQVLIGSMFSLIAMSTVLYIAFRAYTIGNDLTEIKELLKQQRTPQPESPLASLVPLETATSGKGALAPGEWPSVVDPAYQTAVIEDGKPAKR